MKLQQTDLFQISAFLIVAALVVLIVAFGPMFYPRDSKPEQQKIQTPSPRLWLYMFSVRPSLPTRFSKQSCHLITGIMSTETFMTEPDFTQYREAVKKDGFELYSVFRRVSDRDTHREAVQ